MLDFDLLVIIAAIPLLAVLSWDVLHLGKLLNRRLRKSKVGESANKALVRGRTARLIMRTWKHKLLLLNILLPIFSIGVMAAALSPAPRIERTYPEWESKWESYSRPIEIVFNVPVQTSSLRPFLSNTELEGEWKYEPYLGFLPVTRVARFYPSNTLPPDRRLVVYMTGVKRIGVDEYHEHPLNLYTHSQAEVFFASPVNESIEVSTDSLILFELNKLNEGLNEWTFEIEPEVEFTVEQPDDKTFVLIPTEVLAQSQTYKVKAFRSALTRNLATNEIIDRENPEQVHMLEFTTVKAPLVKKFTPSGTGVKVDSVITIEFEIVMNKQVVEEMMSIVPTIEGELVWIDDYTLQIIPTELLPKETKYTISFPAGLQSANGGVSEIPIEHSFTTIGAVRVSEFSPKQNTVRVPRNSNIAVKFDQEVDHASAQSKFIISPSIGGSFSWSGNTMKYNPSGNMGFNTKYTVTVRKGVKTVNGLDSKQDFSVSFTTVPNQTIIAGFGAGSWDRQDYNFSCGVAALKMALRWKNVSVSEDYIINSLIGVDSSSMNCSSGTCYWGNPNRNFLGLPNGSGTYGTGQNAYGIHWQPAINVYANYGITTELRRNWNTTGLAQAIDQGHPVQIWWWNGVSNLYGNTGLGGARIDWIDTQTGQPVEAIHGMHSILVVGFNGDPTNPTSFIVLDPWWGYNTYDLNKFNAQWPKLQNTGVIIY